jgi:hypothetical protein
MFLSDFNPTAHFARHYGNPINKITVEDVMTNVEDFNQHLLRRSGSELTADKFNSLSHVQKLELVEMLLPDYVKDMMTKIPTVEEVLNYTLLNHGRNKWLKLDLHIWGNVHCYELFSGAELHTSLEDSYDKNNAKWPANVII